MAANEGARAELMVVNDRLQRHAAPCGTKPVLALLTPLVSLYGVPDKSESEWKTFWRFYTEALGEIPLEALKAGIDDYVSRADSEFFPKPGPLKALCMKHAEPILKAAHRAMRSLEISPEVAKRFY